MSDSITINVQRAYFSGQDQITQGLISSSLTLNNPPLGNLQFSPGTGAGQVLQETEFQLLIPPSGNSTINLHTGVVTGSGSTTLTTGSGAAFALSAGIKLIEFDLLGGSGSASSINLYAGSASGWNTGIGGATFTVRNGAGNSGGHFRNIAGDSIGFAVSASLANLVINNADSSNTATVNGYLAGG